MAWTFALGKQYWQAQDWDVGCGMWDFGFRRAWSIEQRAPNHFLLLLDHCAFEGKGY
jgi:hypothetical protein